MTALQPSRIVEASLQELELLQENTLPFNINTTKTTRYAANLYKQWEDRKRTADVLVPALDSGQAEELAAAIPRFLLEIRTNKGKKYRGESIKVIYASLNRYLVQKSGFNIFHDPRFRKCRDSIDRLTKDLIRVHKPHKKSACAVPLHVEQSLWETGVLGPSTPRALVDGLMWKFGTLFSVRGGLEYRNERKGNVRFEVISPSSTRVIYTQSEQNVKLSCKERRVVTHIEDPRHPNSFTALFNLYISRLPQACDLANALWFAPNTKGFKPMANGDFWFCCTPIGLNQLATFVKRIMKPYGDCYTNHSLRATAIKSMINAGVSDRDIIRHTGLKSLATIAKYHRNDDNNICHISKALEAPSTTLTSTSSDQISEPPTNEPSTSNITSNVTAKLEDNVDIMSCSEEAPQTGLEDCSENVEPNVNTQSNVTKQISPVHVQPKLSSPIHYQPKPVDVQPTKPNLYTSAHIQPLNPVHVQTGLSYQMQPVQVHLVHPNPVLAQAMMLSRITRSVLDSVTGANNYKTTQTQVSTTQVSTTQTQPVRRKEHATTNTDISLPAGAAVTYTVTEREAQPRAKFAGQYHRLGVQRQGEVAVNTRLSLPVDAAVRYNILT